MERLLDLAQHHGLLLCGCAVALGATAALTLLACVHATLRFAVSRRRERQALRRVGLSPLRGLPAAPAFTAEDEGRAVVVVGHRGDGGDTLRVGAVDVKLLGASAEVRPRQTGERVIARGVLTRGPDDAGAMFRDAAGPRWTLTLSGAARGIATIAPYAPRPRRAHVALAAALSGAAFALVGVGLIGAPEFVPSDTLLVETLGVCRSDRVPINLVNFSAA